MKNKQLRENFSKNSRKLAEKKFDQKIFIKKNILNYEYEDFK